MGVMPSIATRMRPSYADALSKSQASLEIINLVYHHKRAPLSMTVYCTSATKLFSLSQWFIFSAVRHLSI